MPEGLCAFTRGEHVNAIADQRAYRLSSIDMLRGLVIVIMAIDHTRDFFSMQMTIDPMGDPNAPLSLALTRWITHFCAPVFVFLAGTSAGLMGARKPPAELCKFLLTRGLWLVFVELVLISTAVTFSPGGLQQFGGKTLAFMQVIWVIGASMVLLAFLQYLGRKTCLLLGTVIVLGHNLLDNHWAVSGGLVDATPAAEPPVSPVAPLSPVQPLTASMSPTRSATTGLRAGSTTATPSSTRPPAAPTPARPARSSKRTRSALKSTGLPSRS